MTSLELKLKLKRGVLAYVRKDINQIFLVGRSALSDKSDSSVDYPSTFLSMYPSAADHRSKYMDLFEEIYSLVIMESQESLFPLETDVSARNEVNSLYYKIVQFYQAISKIQSDKDTPKGTTSDANVISHSQTMNQSLSRSRLPKVSLPLFSGKIEHWPKFKQLFQSLIHSNSDVPALEKFHYLSTSLSGEPQSLIASLAISEENYLKAWESLCKRYDNKRLLATAYLDKILEFGALKGPPTTSSLQSFIANVGESVAGLKSIEIQDEADFVWLTLALRKLDPETRKHFEVHSVNVEWPTFAQLVDFVHGRSRVLQLSLSSEPRTERPLGRSRVLATTSSPPTQQKKFSCHCQPSHPLYRCPFFLKKSSTARKLFLKGKLVCYNCLSAGHISKECPSSTCCHSCGRRHHTLLHESLGSNQGAACSPPPPDASLPQPQREHNPCTSTGTQFVTNVTGPTQVILGTAEALILDSQDILRPIRLLVDCGSQFSLITADCARRLGLCWVPSRVRPLGAGEMPIPKVKGKLLCQLKSKLHPDRSFQVEPLVVSTITGKLPQTRLRPVTLPSFKMGPLADPQFWEPQSIDFLLGGDLFMKILTGGPIPLNDDYEALPTVFGLIVLGTTNRVPACSKSLRCYSITEAAISDDLITKFWETEEIILPPENERSDPCEDHFLETYRRDDSGRYILALPFKSPPDGLEKSSSNALAQYKTLEYKMNKQPLLKTKYQDFLQEYLDLGHMCPASGPSSYVIPHHGVFKPNDPDAKIRVVFNASAKTENGSLNDKLHIGPKLQHDITVIILNFRRHQIAVTADIIKMYRQILIRPEDRCFQHIYWRPNPDSPLQIYELNTVTYGLASAPFQALRTIIQLTKDEGEPFPLAARALLDDIYVDDIVSGADSLKDALILKDQLIGLLNKGQFKVHKWASNSPEFLESLGVQADCQPLTLSPRDAGSTKILGMCWDPKEDTFFYQVRDPSPFGSKRAILSTIARLFDPMGYLAPVLFKAKTILQLMWKSKLDWDEQPSAELNKMWAEFSGDLHELNKIKIPRHVLTPSTRALQLLGYCDASLKGFSAVFYLRVITSEDEIKISLLKAKTKLAPLKTLSVPRLELSAAHLLIKLYLSITPFIKSIGVRECKFFSDSTIVLAWLQHSPHMLQTFVANRVSYITSHSDSTQWFHVASQDNPADIASRGLGPESLLSCALWWAGPKCLNNLDWTPLPPPTHQGDILELRSGVSLVLDTGEPEFITWIGKFSNYLKMVHSLAYVIRFIKNSKPPEMPLVGPLSALEIEEALMKSVKLTQDYEFRNEYCWKEDRPLSKRLKVLASFADNKGILRVGGRLLNADLSDETKFPIILPGKCHLISLLINHFHHVNFHMGYQGLHTLISRKFWVFRLRQVIKSTLRTCLTCLKLHARPQNPFMGNLPSCRVRPSRPFSECGVDYAGPFSIKTSSRKNAPVSKAYLCLFVCMATRAVHLELVSSLTTDAFLACLDRFVARRGCPSSIFSDCGTNFVGAERRLKELFMWLKEPDTRGQIFRSAASKGFQWHFNPPHAPHFGGIWEAAVKSTKRHLYCVTNARAFYFEELATIFVRIEAILNSRPLCPLPDGPSHGDVLTPGHFLIGAPLVTMPDGDLQDVPLSHLSRWQLVSNCVQHFWRRWHVEYLQTLQRRPKWFSETRPLKEGHLVLLPDPTSLPLQWRIGRIVQCHPGSDGIVRVVSVKDKRGTFKHPVHKIASLSHLCESST